LLAGDAAGYIEPFTGEGIRWALQSGAAMGRFAQAACQDWRPSIVDDWESWYAAEISRSQRLCRWLAWGLKRPVARWLGHHLLRVSPAVGTTIIARINNKAVR
jgi:flavin-dependent dehydrogenase